MMADTPLKPRWLTESLRLTGFLSPDHPLPSDAGWAKLVGSEPESIVSKPGQGLHQEEGQFEGRKLSFRRRPVRFDWLLRRTDATTEDSPWIGEFSETLGIFVPLMKNWFEKCPPLKRIAFGALVVHPETNVANAFHRLSTYLPSIKMEPENTSDLLYQINRRRDSAVGLPGLTINRISKWSSMTFGQVLLSVSPEGATEGPRSELITAHLELDINTVKEYSGILPGDKLKDIFDELVSLGVEISEKGDIP